MISVNGALYLSNFFLKIDKLSDSDRWNIGNGGGTSLTCPIFLDGDGHQIFEIFRAWNRKALDVYLRAT